jgi:hypothetical protein
MYFAHRFPEESDGTPSAFGRKNFKLLKTFSDEVGLSFLIFFWKMRN